MKKWVVFLIGMITGIILLFGSVAGAVVVIYTSATPKTVWPEAEDYIGDFASMSMSSIVSELAVIITEKSGLLTDENGDNYYYTLEHFGEDYNIDFESLGNELEFEFSNELLAVPIFTLFSENGFDSFSQNTEVVAFTGFLSDLFGEHADDVTNALDGLTIADIINPPEGEDSPLIEALSEIQLGWIIPLNENENPLLGAVANCYIGKVITAFLDNEIFVSLAPGGALESLGEVSFVDILGGEDAVDATINSILGDKTISSLINEDGDLDVFGLLEGLQVGTILGYSYNDGFWFTSENEKVSGAESFFANIYLDSFTDENFDFATILDGAYIGTFLDYTIATAERLEALSKTGFCASDCEIEEHKHSTACQYLCSIAEHAHSSDCESPCLIEEHSHSIDCESTCSINEHKHKYLWLNEAEPASGLMNALANLDISSLFEPGFDISNVFGDVYLGELLNYTKDGDVWKDASNNAVDSLMNSLVDIKIGDLLGRDFSIDTVLGDVYLGELLNYTKDGDVWKDSSGNPVDSLTNSLADIKIGDLLGEDFSIDTVLGDVYLGELLNYTKDGDVWEDSSGNPVDSLMNSLADIKIGDLLGEDFSIDTVLGDVYLGELLGYNYDGENWTNDEEETLDGLIAAFADIKLGDLLGEDFSIEEVLGDLYLGELLGYTKGEGDTWLDSDEAQVTGLMDAFANIKLEDILGDDFDITSVMADVYVGELMNYTIATQNQLEDWGEEDNFCADDCDIDHEHDYLWVVESSTPGTYEKVETVNNVMANVLLRSMFDSTFDFTSLINDISLGDVITISEGDILYSLRDCSISNISSGIDDIYLGDILSLYRKQVEILQSDVESNSLVPTNDVVEKGSLIAKIDADNWYQAELVCETSHSPHTSACYEYVWFENSTYTVLADGINKALANMQIGNLGGSGIIDKVNTLKIADVLSYQKATQAQITTLGKTGYCSDNCDTDHEHKYLWMNGETPVEGIMGAISSTKISNLSNVIDTLTLEDVLGENANSGILKSLKHTSISNLASEIDNISLGDALGLFRREVDVSTSTTVIPDSVLSVATGYAKLANDGRWYNSRLVCTTSNPHTAECFEFVWYEEESALDVEECVGIAKALANLQLGNLSPETLKNKFNTLTLNDVIDISPTASPLLKEISNTEIANIADVIDEMSMGTILGMVRNEIDDISAYTTIIIENEILSNGVSFVKADDGSWFEAEFNCATSLSHSAECYDFVWYEDDSLAFKALGINKSIANITLQNFDTSTLTDILLTLTIKDLIDDGILDLSDQYDKLNVIFCDHGGSLAEYTAALVSDNTLTYREYLDSIHTDDVNDYAEDLANWQNLSLPAFLEAILNNIGG